MKPPRAGVLSYKAPPTNRNYGRPHRSSWWGALEGRPAAIEKASSEVPAERIGHER